MRRIKSPKPVEPSHPWITKSANPEATLKRLSHLKEIMRQWRLRKQHPAVIRWREERR